MALQSHTGVYLPHVELTEGPFERMKGLLGKKHFPADHIMWFRPCTSIHTCCMQFTIDVVFLSKDLVVTDIRIAVKPWRIIVGAQGSHSVLEAQTGWLENKSLVVGMPFTLPNY